MAIYNRIGKTYDATRRADPFIAGRLNRYLNLQIEGRYLDVACGTGNYTAYLAEISGNWHGVDQSATMLEKAREKSERVAWHRADVSALPFDETSFDGAICTLAIHYFGSLEDEFSEVSRVLKTGGAFAIFTSAPEQTGSYWLAEYFPQAIRKSAEALPKLEIICAALRKSGFTRIETENYSVSEDLQDLFLYSGKFKPEMYLDADFRANISTFALLADEREIETGCRRLAADIKSGRIQSTIERHKNSSDYLFVIAKA